MDVHDTPARHPIAAPAGAAPPLARWWIRPVVAVAVGVAALVGTGTGVATAWDSPGTAVVSCAPDRQHWQGTITISGNGPSAYTLTESVLDVMRWSASADLTGMAPGTVLARGATMTAEVTGLPLGTDGATVTYTGTYADGRVEINNVTLSRPVPSCAELAPVATTVPDVVTTVAATTTTVAVAPETTATATADTEFAVSGEVSAATATTVDAGAVLGEEETSTSLATLANTGGRSNRALALTALALLIVGAGLAWSSVIRRTRDSSSS